MVNRLSTKIAQTAQVHASSLSTMVRQVRDRWSARSPEMVASQLREASGSYPLTFAITLIVTASIVLTFRDRPDFARVAIAGALQLAIGVGTLVKWFID